MRSLVSRKGLVQIFHYSGRRCKPFAVTTPRFRPPIKAMQSSERKNKHSLSYIQVLGNGTDTGETTPSIMLFFNAYRYIFNAGEGFQRYCFQHRLKLGKMSDIFLTRMSMEAAGGVPGLLITLSDIKTSGAVHVHGPLKLDQLMNALRTFISLPSIDRTFSNFGSASEKGLLGEALVSNEQVEIRPILILPEKPVMSTGPLSTSEEQDSRTIVPCACYVCQLADIPGRFHPETAKELGVVPGPEFKKLSNGISVISTNGNVVRPEQVIGRSKLGPIVLIVDCPDHTYSSSLFMAPAFEQHLNERERDLVMVHLGAFDVVSSQSYIEWMRRFPTGTEHIIVNDRAANSMAIMRKAAVVQSKLNLVDPVYFPLPKTIESLHEDWKQEGAIMGKDLLQYHLKPVSKKGVDLSQLLDPFDLEKIVATFRAENPTVTKSIDAFHQRRRENGAEQSTSKTGHEIAPDELEITFLGTGAAIPSKYRNVTGIYLDFFDRGSMMLDCGEGTYGQLIRRFGREQAAEAIKKLQYGHPYLILPHFSTDDDDVCIWISHIHADHHIGLPTVLRERRKLLGPSAAPLLVIGPCILFATIQSFEELEPINFRYLFSEECGGRSSHRAKKSRLVGGGPQGMLEMAKTALNLKEINSFAVDHCPYAYGVTLVSRNGWKVVFSGDTVPCESVATHAADATLLIHEATFEEELKSEAIMKRHSTVRDAVEIAKHARAYRTILTHFSQRYPKIPVIESDGSGGICVAFDLMTVNMSDLEMLPHLIDPCQGLFREEQDENETMEHHGS